VRHTGYDMPLVPMLPSFNAEYGPVQIRRHSFSLHSDGRQARDFV